jgi:outer membrane putative beta-barrel porin/alpha-amylase
MAQKAATQIVFGMMAATVFAGMFGLANAQDLEPRAYSPAPVGTNFVAVSYGHSRGDLLPDPTLPIQNASLQFSNANFVYYHAFGLFGRQTSVSAVVPYVWGSGEALVSGAPTHIYRSGLADPGLRLSYILHGSPALNPQDFKERTHKMIVGASVIITVPLGQYDPKLLVNIGTNRWSLKPQIGLSRELGKWTFDLYLSGSFFTGNSDFFGGHMRKQAPLAASQVHISRTLRPGMWVAADGIYYTGGRTTVDGVPDNDLQQSVRVGLTFALPVEQSQSLKFQYVRGAIVRVGGDFTTVAATYQYRFMTRR